MFIWETARQELVSYLAEISTQAAASAEPVLSSSIASQSKQYICPADIIHHCKEQIHTKMLRCSLLGSYMSCVSTRHLLKTRPACLSLLSSISQLKKLRHTAKDSPHVTEQASSSTRDKSWLTITVTLLFNVSLMSAQEKKSLHPSQSNFINNSHEQIATFYWEKTTALCTKAELGKLHTEMLIMQIYLMNIFRQEWRKVYFL